MICSCLYWLVHAPKLPDDLKREKKSNESRTLSLLSSFLEDEKVPKWLLEIEDDTVENCIFVCLCHHHGWVDAKREILKKQCEDVEQKIKSVKTERRMSYNTFWSSLVHQKNTKRRRLEHFSEDSTEDLENSLLPDDIGPYEPVLSSLRNRIREKDTMSHYDEILDRVQQSIYYSHSPSIPDSIIQKTKVLSNSRSPANRFISAVEHTLN